MVEVKSELRSALRIARATAFATEPEAGVALVTAFPAVMAPTKGRVLAGYMPFQSELDPRTLMRALMAEGASLCLPRTPPKGAIGAGLTFHLCDPDNRDDLEQSAWGVLEPKAHLPRARPDMVLVPLLGFDRAGHRLGQGQGHYDRTLHDLRATGPLVTVGLAFGAQEVAHVPAEPHDQRLDWIITPIEAYRVPT